MRADVDPDAFAITVTQQMFANVQNWAQGQLSLDEMDARMRFGLALSLSAIATRGGEAGASIASAIDDVVIAPSSCGASVLLRAVRLAVFLRLLALPRQTAGCRHDSSRLAHRGV